MEVAIRTGSGPELEEVEVYSYDRCRNQVLHRIVRKHWSSFDRRIRYQPKSLVHVENEEAEVVVYWRTDQVAMAPFEAVAHHKIPEDADSAPSLLQPRREESCDMISFAGLKDIE